MIRFPPQRILVPFDFTDVSKAAFRHAGALAKGLKAAVDVVYVEETVPIMETAWFASRLEFRTRRKILAHLRSIIGDGPRLHVEAGDPAAVLMRLARTLRPHLIVMGTHGRTGFDRVWLGSVTEAVVRNSPVPVLSVRRPAPQIQRVLSPVNFASYSEYGFLYAAAAAVGFGVPLTALHVVADPTRCGNPELRMRSLELRLPEPVKSALKFEGEVRKGAPTEEILRAAKDTDLVVLVAHRKSLLEDFVLGTTAERILRHCRAPVLSVPAPRAPFFLGTSKAHAALPSGVFLGKIKA